MPFYEYQCSSCGHHLEALQKISDPPLRKCPDCSKSTLKRLMSAPVFRLKGSGWYETDFKSDKENKRNLADRDEQPSESKADGKGDSSTSETKTESKSKVVSKPVSTKASSSKAVSKSPAKSGKKKPAKAAAKKKGRR